MSLLWEYCCELVHTAAAIPATHILHFLHPLFHQYCSIITAPSVGPITNSAFDRNLLGNRHPLSKLLACFIVKLKSLRNPFQRRIFLVPSNFSAIGIAFTVQKGFCPMVASGAILGASHDYQ
jgi:hypothetical protein